MLGVQDAVHHRIAHVQVRRSHVDLGAQNSRAVGKFAGPHALEQIQIFFYRAVAIRAVLARLGERAAVLANFVGGQIVDVGLAGFDELHRPLVELVEIIGGIEEAVPLEAEPLHVRHDGIDVLRLFLGRDWCRQNADWFGRQIRRRGRSRGRSPWHARCADSRWARAGKRVCTSPPYLLVFRSSRMMSRMKLISRCQKRLERL